MPSVSAAEHGLMGLASTEMGQRKLRAEGKKPPPMSVAKEFLRADRGKHFNRVARKASKR